jgi:hypothetical protein
MSNYWRVLLAAILVLSITVSCSKSTRSGYKLRTPKADQEAELIALCLSGEMIAPQDLYDQVRRDLATIRASFGDNYESVAEIEFRTPWLPGCLVMAFDDTTERQVLSGEYHAWDLLNKKLELVTVDTLFLRRYGFSLLYFEGRLHPYRLSELYGVLPGVRYAFPNHIAGDWPNIYARRDFCGMSYLFRKAWGDCPAGCIYSEYWYFRVDDNWPMFVGHWVSHEDSHIPEWWEEAKVNRDHYCD